MTKGWWLRWLVYKEEQWTWLSLSRLRIISLRGSAHWIAHNLHVLKSVDSEAKWCCPCYGISLPVKSCQCSSELHLQNMFTYIVPWCPRVLSRLSITHISVFALRSGVYRCTLTASSDFIMNSTSPSFIFSFLLSFLSPCIICYSETWRYFFFSYFAKASHACLSSIQMQITRANYGSACGYVCVCKNTFKSTLCWGRFELASAAFPLELPAADKLGPQAHKSKINHNIGAPLTHIC